MDKNTLETYELLPANNSEVEAVRFFVVENDGNFHILTKSIQYVTQEETNKEEQVDTQSSAMYNIDSQQFYVNVDNSTELISVSDEYILPSTDSNVYTNSYLLESDVNTNTQEERVEHVTINELKPENLPINNLSGVNENNKQSGDCAEVTISDDQYKTFEKNGWILLESNEKIYLLNTLGLHDITTNDKLIQKLRNESNNFTEIDANSIERAETDLNINHVENYNQYDDTVFDNGNENLKMETDNITNGIENNAENCEKQEIVFQQDKVNLNVNSNDVSMDHTVEVIKEQNGSAYKIKTNIGFEDIPNKIILGKTSNGKRLVAKVVKSNKPMTISEKIIENQKLSGTDLSNSQFIGLLKHTLRSNGNTYSSEDIAAAEAVVVELFKVPAIRQSIMGQNLIVTKIRNSKENTGKLKRKLTLVTGKVKTSDNNQGAFVHLPNLLQYLIMESEKMEDDTNETNNVTRSDDITIFHVHESETLCEDNSVRVNINLTRRQLAIDSIMDRRLLKTYACGACASIFNTSSALKEHRESLCLDMDNNLTIDTDNMTPNKDTYKMIKTGRKKLFCCLQCNARFSKNSLCQKHIKTHFLPANALKSEDIKKSEDQFKMKAGKSQLHKCKMCPAQFFVPSTLSKHILTKHIKLKTN